MTNRRTATERPAFPTQVGHRKLITRRDRLRTSMYIIPGNIVRAGETDIVRCSGGPGIYHRFVVIRCPIEVVRGCRQATPYSPVMMHRSAGRRLESRGRRSRPSSTRYSRIGQCLARGKDKRDATERRDKRPTHSTGHGTHQLAGYGAAFLRTLGRAFRARKGIINY
jgi:hypothetical protein